MTVAEGIATQSQDIRSTFTQRLANRFFSDWRVELPLSLLLAIAAILAAKFSFESQIAKHDISTKGLSYVWFVAGWLFASTKAVFFVCAFFAAFAYSGKLFFTKLVMSVNNLATCIALLFTNTLLIASVSRHGVSPHHWSTYMLAACLAITIIVIVVRRKKDPGAEQWVRFGMGANIYPTWIQGGVFALLGSGSMPWTAMTVCLAMALFMWLLAWLRAQGEGQTDAHYAHLLAKRDFIAQLIGLGGGWTIGQQFDGGLWSLIEGWIATNF